MLYIVFENFNAVTPMMWAIDEEEGIKVLLSYAGLQKPDENIEPNTIDIKPKN
jgi:hypothetical protein